MDTTLRFARMCGSIGILGVALSDARDALDAIRGCDLREVDPDDIEDARWLLDRAYDVVGLARLLLCHALEHVAGDGGDAE